MSSLRKEGVRVDGVCVKAGLWWVLWCFGEEWVSTYDGWVVGEGCKMPSLSKELGWMGFV